jgi:hypothetical protein
VLLRVALLARGKKGLSDGPGLGDPTVLDDNKVQEPRRRHRHILDQVGSKGTADAAVGELDRPGGPVSPLARVVETYRQSRVHWKDRESTKVHVNLSMSL